MRSTLDINAADLNPACLRVRFHLCWLSWGRSRPGVVPEEYPVWRQSGGALAPFPGQVASGSWPIPGRDTGGSPAGGGTSENAARPRVL